MTTARDELQRAIAALEAQHAVLGDAVLEIALAPLRAKLAALTPPTTSPPPPVAPPTAPPAIPNAPLRPISHAAVMGVGRIAERAALHSALAQATFTPGLHWLTIVGEPGVGKSRLLADFEASLPASVNVLRARARSTADGPYNFLADLLFSALQAHETDPPETLRAQLTAGFAATLGPELGAEAATFIGHLSGVDFSASPWLAHIATDTAQIRGRAVVLLRKFLVAASTPDPLVFLLEDLQDADSESLAFLSDVFAEEPPWHLCVFSTTRESLWARPGLRWGQSPTHRTLALTPLDATGARALVLGLLGQSPNPPAWLITHLVERGAGHPYFTEELLRWFIDQGLVTPLPGAWQIVAEPPAALAVPQTLQAVLQARLESLTPDDRTALQQAAVLGTVFWEAAVADLGQTTHPPTRWERLSQRAFITAQSPARLAGQREYRFTHTLLRDVVYELTLRKHRRAYHLRAAAWLAQAAGTQADEWEAAIAEHYAQADETLQALEYLYRAGRRALQISAFREARTHFERALTLAGETLIERQDPLGDSPLWQVILTRLLSDAYFGLAEYATAQVHCAESLTLARASGDSLGILQALTRLGRLAYERGDYAAARTYVDEALTRAQSRADQAGQVTLYRMLGNLVASQGDFATARGYYEHSLALARAAGDRAGEAGALGNLGRACYRTGAIAEAQQYYEASVAISRATHNRWILSVALCNVGIIAYRLHDYPAARALEEESLALAREIGNRWMMGWALGELGLIACAQGRLPEADDALQEALRLAHASGALPRVLYVLTGYAYLLAARALPLPALELLGLTTTHPANDNDVHQLATPLVADLRAQLPAADAEAALARGATRVLDEAVRQWL